MPKLLKSFTLIILFTISFLSAAELKLGFFAGGNEFRTDPQEYFTPRDLYQNHEGHYYFDESGRTLQAGVQWLYADHIALRLSYRTPRQSKSYTYSADYPLLSRPIEDNPRHVTVVNSYLSGINVEARYYILPGRDLSFYAGIGAELAILTVNIHEINNETYYYPWLAIPNRYFTRLGTKLLGGLILPAGVLVNVIGQIYLDLSINYTFLHLGEWDVTGDIPVEQDLSGMYLKIGIGYHISSY
jgi:opacity protein-like surface antigen